MLYRAVSILVILFFVECDSFYIHTDGYYTETGRERDGSGSGDGNKTDFKTWVKRQDEDEMAGEYGSTNEDDDDEDHDITAFPDCDETIDITFILDASESIGPVGFRTIKSYTKRILEELDLSHCDNVGVIKFTDFVSSETFLRTRDTKQNICTRIDALQEPEKLVQNEVNMSSIPLALFFADELVFTNQLGSRQKSKKYIVLMTDGKQPEHGISNRSLTLEILVKRLTKKGIHILVLTIGENPSMEELVRLTTEKRNIFPERRFNDLMNLLVPKEKQPNALNEMATDFYVTDNIQADGENSFDFEN